jgi:outer membrane protein TolC
MNRPLSKPWLRHCAAAAAALAATVAGAAPLALTDALDAAMRDAPTLAAIAARIEAAKQASVSAGERPDPKLRFGLENYPVGGPDRWRFTRDFMTMQRVAWTQDLPSRDKRDARSAVANARIARSMSDHRIAATALRRETALAWIRRHTVERQIEQLAALDAENRLLETAVRAQLAGGKGMPADAVMPRHEAVMLAERRDELSAQRELAIAALRRWVGDAAGEPLQGGVPAWPLEREALHARLQRHPELTAFDTMGAMLDAEVNEARSMKTPDWGVEVSYQRRGSAFGDMVSVMFSVDLPIFSERRQDPQIAAKMAERRGVDAERELALREHRQMIEADLAELARLDRGLERVRQQFLPLAEQRIELAMAAYRSGKGALTDVIAARRERAETLMKSAAMQGERDTTAARLHFTYDHEGAKP